MPYVKNASGFYPADILVPKEEYLPEWCVPPVDQHTSEPEFWDSLKEAAGSRPSTLDLVLPEAYLGTAREEEALRRISHYMKSYLENGCFREIKNSLIRIEREQSTGLFRRGLLGAIDLEEYDFDPDKKAAIRATEETVPSRLPPRIRIRETASVELPHILVLYNDPLFLLQEAADKTLARIGAVPLYDFRLPVCGHRIRGTVIPGEQAGEIMNTLDRLLEGSFLAVGDGNHSLAAAKALYEMKKKDPSASERELALSRYALVELVSCQDEAMPFEPIHRIVSASISEIQKHAEASNGEYEYRFALLDENHETSLLIRSDRDILPVAVLQEFLDRAGWKVDYIHDEDTLRVLSKSGRGTVVLLPGLDRGMLFPTVEKIGVLPRKTFSLGRAEDKRFYLEGRRISER